MKKTYFKAKIHILQCNEDLDLKSDITILLCWKKLHFQIVNWIFNSNFLFASQNMVYFVKKIMIFHNFYRFNMQYGLQHHINGEFSKSKSVFDLKLGRLKTPDFPTISWNFKKTRHQLLRDKFFLNAILSLISTPYLEAVLVKRCLHSDKLLRAIWWSLLSILISSKHKMWCFINTNFFATLVYWTYFLIVCLDNYIHPVISFGT